jgi:hypothetical protein
MLSVSNSVDTLSPGSTILGAGPAPSVLPRRILFTGLESGDSIPSLMGQLPPGPVASAISIEQPISTASKAFPHWVRLLREATALSVPVSWQLTNDPPIDVGLLAHLSAPTYIVGVKPEVPLDEWRSKPQGRTLYWRQGPDFIQVRDTRIGRVAARWLLDDLPTQRVFRSFLEPQDTPLESSGPFRDLSEAGLLLVQNAYSVALPYRVVQWPIPYTAI